MMNLRMRFSNRGMERVAVMVMVLSCAVLSQTQPGPPASAEKVVRKVGTLSSLTGNKLVMKTDDGQEVRAILQDNARMVRIPPGEKDLKNAVPLALQELQPGDRVLVAVRPSGDAD